MLSFVLAGSLFSSCAKANLVPDTTLAGGAISSEFTPEETAQKRADLIMAALGDAYRFSTEAGEVNDAALASLSDGFSGVAYDAEEANLRDAVDSRNALARVPANPDLFIDIVVEGTDQCQVAEAVFDDRPLQAFPVADEGIPVIVRIVGAPDEPIWRIDVLASVAQLGGRRVSCTDVSAAKLVPTTFTATTVG